MVHYAVTSVTFLSHKRTPKFHQAPFGAFFGIMKLLTKEAIMAKKKEVAWETPESTEEAVPTTPVPEANEDGFNTAE